MIESFVATYGYLAVFAGTLLEGETVLLAAGYASHQGLLDWRIVLATAVAGACLGDQIGFILGRTRGAAILRRFPAVAKRVPQVHAILDRHYVLFVLANRFLYGLRVAGPIVVGTSALAYVRYALLDVAGALLWAPAVVFVGYTFGVATARLSAIVKHAEMFALGAVVLVVFAIWLTRRLRAARRGADSGNA